MYPRNAASPPEIAIGAVVQISNGAVQTSGCSVAVRPKGGSESAGGGTLAYGASGICYYTPTQAETNFEEFSVVAYKTGCIPVVVTVVTTESAVAGRSSLGMIFGAALTEGAAGRLAAAFTKFFDKASPTGTINSLPDAAPNAEGGLPISNAGGLDLDAKIGALSFGVAGDLDVNVQSWKGSAAPDVVTDVDIADAILDRDLSAGPDTGTEAKRTVRQALRALRNKMAISVAKVRTVFKENDTTPSWTSQLTTDASAEPITGDDPADS